MPSLAISIQKYSPRSQPLIHLFQGVDDDIHRTSDRRIAQDSVFRNEPVLGNIGQILVTDDDQDIVVGLVSVLRLIDPVISSVTAEQDYVLDPAVLLPRLRCARGRECELIHQNLLHALQLILLSREEMVRVVPHPNTLAIYESRSKCSLVRGSTKTVSS